MRIVLQYLFVLAFVVSFAKESFSQQQRPTPPPEVKQFDFWIGENGILSGQTKMATS